MSQFSKAENNGKELTLIICILYSRTLSHAETSIEVFVASPYKLAMLERPSEIKTLLNDSFVEEVICESKGSGLVKPVIKWVGQGKYINPEDITISTWEVSISS